MNQSPAFISRGSFTPVDTLNKWVVGIFIVQSFVCLIAIISGISQAGLLNTAINGGIVTESEATLNDIRELVISVLQTGIAIAGAIMFLIWVHRSYKNLSSLNFGKLSTTPGWAVGWFFVPVVSLYRPYKVVAEIMRGSDPGSTSVGGVPDENSSSIYIVGLWWALYLISNFISQIAARLILRGETLSELLTSTYVYMASDSLDIIGLIITILMVRKISQFQETKNSRIILGAPVTTASG
jgi:hypothetical protein